MWTRASSFALAAVTLAGAPALAQPTGLPVKVVPPSANVLAIVDAEKLLTSKIGEKAGWAAKTEEKYRSGLSVVPPGAKRVLVAGELSFATSAWAWKAALIQGAGLPTPAAIAEREKSEVTEASGVPVVLSPRGVYFAAPAEGEVAVFQPANRQTLARWAAQVREPGPGPAKYLANAAKTAEKHHVVLAIDLSEAVDPTAAAEVAAALLCVVKKKVDAAAFGKFLAGVKGVTFTATATDAVRGTLRIDFPSNPLKFEKVMKDAVLEILDDEGANLPELAKWESSFGDTSYTLTGVMSPGSLERVLGLLAFPQAGPVAAATPTGPATRRYYDAVAAVVADIQNLKAEPTYDRMALWHETAARKIEALNPRGVDPVAVQYGRAVAGRFHAIAGSMKGVPIDVARLEAGAYTIAWATPNTGWFGVIPRPGAPSNMGLQTNLPQVRLDQSKVVAEDMKRREQLWTQINELTSRTRSDLAAKYQDF